MNWLWKLTGGRPMIFIRHEFDDIVVNKPVNSYMDRLGRYWKAHTAWDWSRMPMRGGEIVDALQKKRQDPNTWVAPGNGGGMVTVTMYGAGGGGAGGAGVVVVPIDEIDGAVVTVGNGAPKLH